MVTRPERMSAGICGDRISGCTYTREGLFLNLCTLFLRSGEKCISAYKTRGFPLFSEHSRNGLFCLRSPMLYPVELGVRGSGLKGSPPDCGGPIIMPENGRENKAGIMRS